MNLGKIGLIAKREFWFNFRRRSFLFAALGIPLITFGALFIVFNLVGNSLEDTSAYKQIGIVDEAKLLVDAEGKPTVTLAKPFVIVADEATANEQLKAQTVDGYFVIPANFISTGQVKSYNRRDLTISESINDKFTKIVNEAIAKQVGDPNLTARLVDPLDKVKIFRVGSTQELDESALLGSFFVPFILVMLVYTAISTTSQFILSGLAEEKENRMMELFMTSARPEEMLWGKVIGLCALGLTQLLIWAVLGGSIAALQGNLDIARQLANYSITPSLLALLFVYFILGYLVYGTLMAGLGALVNGEQEGRQYAGLLSFLAIVPVIFITEFLEHPNTGLPLFLSMFPLTSPIAMIMRISWATVPTAQIVISIAILLISIFASVWISARLMRVGMLNYGKKLNIREIVRGVVEGRNIITARNTETA
ncbi:MAG: ABC transporter permease [Anaerolineae bacterium]|nr:ABC transporter permease [Anaerolineae bacterium]